MKDDNVKKNSSKFREIVYVFFEVCEVCDVPRGDRCSSKFREIVYVFSEVCEVCDVPRGDRATG